MNKTVMKIVGISLFAVLGCTKDQMKIGEDLVGSGGTLAGVPGGSGGTGAVNASTGGEISVVTGTGGVTASIGGTTPGAGGVTTSTGGATTGAGGEVATGGITGGETGGVDSGIGSGGAIGVVTFKNGKAEGAMTGYGWVDLGALDVLTNPTCGGAPITAANRCPTSPNWNSNSALCISGTIPRVTGNPIPDYNNNWGIEIGVNARERLTGPGSPAAILGHVFETIRLDTSGYYPTSFPAATRVNVHVLGEPEAVTYCGVVLVPAPSAAASPILLTSLNTKCWGDPTTVFLTRDKIPYIDNVAFQIASDSVVAYNINNFCLTGITFE